MDTRIYDKARSSETLWAAMVALLIGLGIVWAVGA